MSERLLLRMEIQETLDRYIDIIDNDRLEEWPDMFVDDCLYEIIPKENEDMGLPAPVIRCDNKRMLHDRITALRHANIFAPAVYRHFLSGLLLTGVAEGSVAFTANYLVINSNQAGQSIVYQTGRYISRLVQHDGEWKFASHRCIFDTSRVQTLLALPI